MSVELDVVLTKPVLIAEIVAEAEKELADLLRLKAAPKFVVLEEAADYRGPVLCRTLAELESDTDPHGILMCVDIGVYAECDVTPFYTPRGEEEILLASISKRRNGDRNLSCALAAAFAIAVAVHCDGQIENGTGVWGQKIHYAAHEFREKLRCRRTHDSMIEVLEEFRENLTL
jgi:hypothetical protein